MPEFTPSLFSSRASVGKRSYFFDVRATKDSKPFLKVTQASNNGEQKQRTFINVFDSELQDFMSALNQAVEYINHNAK